MAPLLARSVATDRAFERLYRRHAQDVYRYAYAVLHNQADAEDVTQTTFMNAYRALERGEEPQTPQHWLIAIAHNVCRQRFRRQARRVQEVGFEIDVADAIVGEEDDDAPTPADITRALGHLAFNQRAALVARELEGRSYAEIAEVLGLSVSAVETLIFRARRALREQLEGSLTCGQAEHFLSRKLDGELVRGERSQLRAHLRECESCRRLARRQRAHRKALKALGAAPLPSSLASLFGGGGAAAVATKVAAVVVASTVAAGGVGYEAHRLLQPAQPKQHPVVRTVPSRPLPTTPIAGIVAPVRAPPLPSVHPAPPERMIVRAVPHPVAHPEPQPPAQPTEPRRPEQEAPGASQPQPPHDPEPTAAQPRGPQPRPEPGHPGRGGGPPPPVEAPPVTVPVPVPVPVPGLPPVETPPVTVPLPPVSVPSHDDPGPQLPGLGH